MTNDAQWYLTSPVKPIVSLSYLIYFCIQLVCFDNLLPFNINKGECPFELPGNFIREDSSFNLICPAYFYNGQSFYISSFLFINRQSPIFNYFAAYKRCNKRHINF